MKISELIYTSMKRRRLNATELASLAGISPETISRWYQGKSTNLSTLDRIADALACRWSLVPIATDITANDLAEVEATLNPQNWKELQYLKAIQKSKRKGMVTYKYSQTRGKAHKDEDLIFVGIIANRKLLHHKVTQLRHFETAKKYLQSTYNVPAEKVAAYDAIVDQNTKCLVKGRRRLAEAELFCIKNDGETAEN